MTTFTVNFNPIIELTDDQFYQLCRANPNVKFELNLALAISPDKLEQK